jgi:hypothetical protein
MAAKKKPAYQDPSKKNRATTKDKPKSSSPSAAQIAALKGPTSTRKATEAITAPGQKATGLAKSTVKGNRFSSTAKTPVYKAQQGLRGTGGSLTSALGYKPTKSNIVNAALTVTALPGSGQVSKYVAGKIAGKVAGPTGDATWTAASKGISAMKGGGRVYKASTPFGKTLGSTKIMNAGQKAASMTGLETRAANIANTAERAAAGAASRITKKIIRNATGGAKVTGVGAAAVANKKKKK